MRKKRILVVDDEEAILFCLKEAIELEGYKVFTASGGKRALKILEKEKVDLVITDLMMPGESGIDLLRKIKSLDQDINVILMTGYASVDSAVEAMQFGTFDYLVKPFEFELINRVIHKALSYKQTDKSVKERKKRIDSFTQERIKDLPVSMTLSELSDLTAGITHSLRNEIGIINSTSENLLNKQNKNDPNIKKYKRLLRSAKYSIILLNNLGSLFLEGKLAPAELNINELLEDIIALFEYKIPSNVKLKKEISPKLPKLILDKNQIEQALVNIINNAIEAMPEGGELSIIALKGRTKLFIGIKDTGIGISKKDLNNVFNLYFSTKKTGCGLGLYLTKKIVEQYKGEISLKSQKGKGTAITIRLPINNEK